MNMQILIKKEIENFCGGVCNISSFGLHFMYNAQHYVYVEDKDPHSLRIVIPHMARVSENKYKKIQQAVNETNREVKYVKVIVLDNGCVSIFYDHRISNSKDDIGSIVRHIIKSLDFAASYIKNKMA